MYICYIYFQIEVNLLPEKHFLNLHKGHLHFGLETPSLGNILLTCKKKSYDGIYALINDISEGLWSNWII